MIYKVSKAKATEIHAIEVSFYSERLPYFPVHILCPYGCIKVISGIKTLKVHVKKREQRRESPCFKVKYLH